MSIKQEEALREAIGVLTKYVPSGDYRQVSYWDAKKVAKVIIKYKKKGE